MPILKYFYIAYRENSGISQVLGDSIPNLRADLEIYGSGLDSTGDLRGGPLLTVLRDGVALCWVRGVHHARGNVWEAWGVLAPRMDSVRYWPSHWPAIKNEPSEESLRRFAEGLEQGWGNSLPPKPESLPLLLTKFHRANVSERPINQFKVPIHHPEDIGALAWLWLLGPIPWASASVSPPRRIAVSSNPEPSYQGIIDAPRPEGVRVSPFIEDLLALVDKGDVRSAGKKLEDFRQQAANLRRSTLGGASASVPQEAAKVDPQSQVTHKKWWFIPTNPFKKDDRKVDEASKSTAVPSVPSIPEERLVPSVPLIAEERRLIAIERKINVLALLVLMVFVMDVVDRIGILNLLFKRKAQATERSTAPTPTQAPQTQPPPQNEEITKVIFDQMTLNRMHGSLIDRLNLTPSPGLKGLDLSTVREVDLRKRLAAAATQIILSESGCAPAASPIDGDIGGATRSRISSCNSQDVREIAQSQEEALKWLHAWLGLPSTSQEGSRP